MSESSSLPWYKQLTPYHWFVFAIASAAWTFDCLDQRLFSLARISALESLAPKGTDPGVIGAMGKNVTAVFLIGWGIGGLIFGALGDRYGRAKMLSLTVLIYSVCTGMNFFSRTPFDFALFRFLTGVGVGGVFGLAVALIAETVPDGARAPALGMLQILSAAGNITAGLCKEVVDRLEAAGTVTPHEGWRWLFLIGAIPALLVVFAWKRLREPEPWLHAKAAGLLPKGAILAPYAGLLAEKRWRKNLLVGAVLASSGVIGLWAIAEYAIDLQKLLFTRHYQDQVLADADVAANVERLDDPEWFTTLLRSVPKKREELLADRSDAAAMRELLASIDGPAAAATKRTMNAVYILQMLGAAAGMWVFAKVAAGMGRRPAFAMCYVLAISVTAYTYWTMQTPGDAFWMMPLMYAVQLGLFAGYAIYLPELFPSRLRSTGTSFCYNLGRFAAAAGSFFSAAIAQGLYGQYGSPAMERYSAITMCAIFMLGLAILPFAPETKGQPLPE